MNKNINKIAIKNIESKSKLFKAFGDETRLRILEYLLSYGDECICRLANKLNKDQSTIFRHIQVLKEAGVVITNKENKELRCSLKNRKRLIDFFEFVTNCQSKCS